MGDVAEADDDLRVASQCVGIQVVDDAVGAFAAPGSDDGADSRIGERGVQVRGTVLIPAGQVSPSVEDVLTQLDPEYP